MPTLTTNLLLTKPDVGGSSDVWGNNLNDDLDLIDALFAPTGAGKVVRTGPDGLALCKGIDINDAAGTQRSINWQTAGVERWSMLVNATAETGADVGSDFGIIRNHDDGTLIDVPLSINRKTGVAVFSKTPKNGANDLVDTASLASLISSEPVGIVKMWVGDGTADPLPGPDGVQRYMLCNGRPLVAADFPDLFAIMGYKFGGGGPTFNLPNTAERVIVGQSPVASAIPQYNAATVGNKFGTGLHTLTGAEIPTHNHTLTDPQHSHDFKWHQVNPNGAGTGAMSFNLGDTTTPGGGAVGVQTHATGITIADFGGGAAHDNVQPSLVLVFIIRVK